MLSTGVLGGLRAGVRRFVCLLACCWAVLALCRAQSSFGQQPSAPPPESAGSFSAADIGTGMRPISGLWQFHLGDDPAWAQPSYDDHTWEQLPADEPWGDAGHPGYAGFAWYRRQITLNPTDKTPLALLLPPLGSVAEVYWNGVKVGGVGTPPPMPHWRFIANQEPVAVPLPRTPGARSGELAVRLWQHRLHSIDEISNSGGFQEAPRLGYGPLIGRMPGQWWDHRLRIRAVPYIVLLLSFFMGIAAFILWVRSRSQWLLLTVAAYVLCYAAQALSALPLDYMTTTFMIETTGFMRETAGLFLILLLADLPQRAGIRGARFWWRASILLSALTFLESLTDLLLVLLVNSSHTQVFQILDTYGQVFSDAYAVFVPVLVVACLILSRLTLPRLLFLCAIGVEVLMGDLSGLSGQSSSRWGWLFALLHRPVLQIYGSNLTVFTLDRLLVLLAIVYAVSDQIGRQVARQRFVDAEMKAAQEIQQVLVPAAEQRQAPGYAVASVYRPASEVGGDFFQIIPLGRDGTHSDGTLIVAGDVSGKGLRAAMTVSLVVGTLRTLAEYDPSPAAVLAGLNRRLIGRTQGGFVTCCAVRIAAHGHATMANAGHCQPYLDGHEVDLPAGLPLGLVEDATYDEIAVDVPHGQQLTLLSDGVVEARNHHGELYGFDRLNQLMKQRPTAEHVADTAVTFGQDDDITVLTVTRLATA